MRKFLVLFLLAICLSACGIEGFESLADLHPPLGLTAFSETNSIILRFVSFNHEDNFSGFNVFIGNSKEEVVRQTEIVTNFASESLPTFRMTSSIPSPTRFELVLSERYLSRDPFKKFTSYIFIGVSAYDSVRRANSVTSNVTNLVITNG